LIEHHKTFTAAVQNKQWLTNELQLRLDRFTNETLMELVADKLEREVVDQLTRFTTAAEDIDTRAHSLRQCGDLDVVTGTGLVDEAHQVKKRAKDELHQLQARYADLQSSLRQSCQDLMAHLTFVLAPPP
jgi:hypothetical protein